MVLNSSFGGMIFHITFYRNAFSFSVNPSNAKLNPICQLLALLRAHPILHVSRIRVNHNFSSAYSTLSDTIGGHFWASKLLRTCRVIKVTIPTNICTSC